MPIVTIGVCRNDPGIFVLRAWSRPNLSGSRTWLTVSVSMKGQRRGFHLGGLHVATRQSCGNGHIVNVRRGSRPALRVNTTNDNPIRAPAAV